MSHCTSSTPGAPIELEIEHEGVGAHPHQDAAGVPAGGGEPAQHGRARRRLVEMHRLRIELGRERDHLVARQAGAGRARRRGPA